MRRSLIAGMAAIFVACTAASAAASVHLWKLHRRAISPQRMRLLQLSVEARSVIGIRPSFRGSADAPYTLVEFIDYECQPCRAAEQRVQHLLSAHKGRVRLTVRNFPLRDIHPHALPAAIAVEIARSQGKFWSAHNVLLAEENNGPNQGQTTILATRSDGSLPSKAEIAAAKAAVYEDVRFGRTINLPGTPSFLLCCPDGRVFWMRSLDSTYLEQCEYIIKGN